MNKSFIKLILGVYTVAFSMFFFIKNRELGLESMYVFAFYFICAIYLSITTRFNSSNHQGD